MSGQGHTAENDALPVREETVEWGMADSGYLGVSRAGMTEGQAQAHLEHDYQHGYSRARLRRRTVVTITGPWEYVPNAEMDGRARVIPPEVGAS